jgi:uncharacterized membrane protein YoaK (UPF0700 family)
MPAAAEPRAWPIPVLLSFVAAYVDTVGFVALFGLFTSHVTGNFVLIGATLAHHDGHAGTGLVTKLLALPSFAAAVALTTLAIRRREAGGRAVAGPVILWQAVWTLAFLLLGWHASPIADPDAAAAMLAGLVGVAAMAVQNTASRIVFSKLAPTTVMTGNVTQVVIDGVDLLRGLPAEAAAVTRARAARMAPPVVAFAVGAIGGALAFRAAGFAALVVPLAALLAVAWHLPREAPALPAA